MNAQHIASVLALHFDPELGSPYWLERQQQLGFDVRREIHSREDFHRLGPMDVGVLRTRPVTDFVPRSLHRDLAGYLLSETGGTTGDPCRRVFSSQEFDSAFIGPWLKAVAEHNFPREGRWLFVGPGGPHIIDRSARYMARSLGSLEPFTVDCDVRWIKRQAKGSMGFKLYMDHVLAQAMNIIGHQQIDTLFTTPPLLVALAGLMNAEQREQIRGIHTGGMHLAPQIAGELQTQFPQAVILPGYGNSLFGVTFPMRWDSSPQTSAPLIPPRGLEHEDVFQVGDPALWLQLAPIPENEQIPQDLIRCVAPGQRGRVIVHRLDPSFLIVNLAERDTAIAVECPDGEVGLACIEALAIATPKDRQGVY
jgi:thienamycin biosynthesis protein ThnN